MKKIPKEVSVDGIFDIRRSLMLNIRKKEQPFYLSVADALMALYETGVYRYT